MPENYKALIVVLPLSLLIFFLAEPIALRFSTRSDFRRRRNIWLVLTVTAFLCPSYWIFVLIAAPLLMWGGQRDANPIAFYLLLLHVIPQLGLDIPNLFALDMYRLLSLCVLVPCIWRWKTSNDHGRMKGVQLSDILLIAYGLIQIILYAPPDTSDPNLLHNTIWNGLRMGVLYFIDVYALYFAVSRSCKSFQAITDALATLCLAGLIMAPMAIFETWRHWLLYTNIAVRWTHSFQNSFYLLRGDALRAQVSAGHSLSLGYLLAIGFGCWLLIQSNLKSTAVKLSVSCLLWLGMIAAYARGPWLGGIVIYLVFAALQPRPLRRIGKAVAISALTFAILLLSPLYPRIEHVLPFMGGAVDAGSFTYRQQLATLAWSVIKQHPLLGDQAAYLQLESLRQGQGIIDLVDTYVSVALFHGLLGLLLFLGPIAIGLYRTLQISRRATRIHPECSKLGMTLSACILGTLVMIGTCSLILAYAELFYVFAGLAAAFVHAEQRLPRPASIPSAVSNGTLGSTLRQSPAVRIFARGRPS